MTHPQLSAAASEELVRRHTVQGATLMSILHAVQDEVGYVPEAAIATLARALSLSRAEIHGVITYYHHFRSAPPARVTVHLCRAEACRSMGTEALKDHVEAHTGCRFDTGHAEDTELESVFCLGQCVLSPSMMINGELHARHVREIRAALCRRSNQSGEGDRMTRIYVPIDSAALALDAEAVAAAIADEAQKRGLDVQIVRNGSRGLFLSRTARRSRNTGRLHRLFECRSRRRCRAIRCRFPRGQAHAKNVGIVDEIPYLKNQQRLTFARIGITDPLSIDDYTAPRSAASKACATRSA
ncbi:NAD-dependent formate dehydrogenase gamma subunit [Candidatus Burkholderia brachyanthoides]|nr:NAD-dependent formate dehydrogenase gamma subunit [Candidatus Burkholderia brachyanthoides]